MDTKASEPKAGDNNSNTTPAFNIEEMRTKERIRWIQDTNSDNNLPIRQKYRNLLKQQLEEALRTGASTKEIEKTAQNIINLDYLLICFKMLQNKNYLIDQEEDQYRTYEQCIENYILNTNTSVKDVMIREITCEAFPARAERFLNHSLAEQNAQSTIVSPPKSAQATPSAPQPITSAPSKPIEPNPVNHNDDSLLKKQEPLQVKQGLTPANTAAAIKTAPDDATLRDAVNKILTKLHFEDHLITLEIKLKYYETKRENAEKNKLDHTKNNYQAAINACNDLIKALKAAKLKLEKNPKSPTVPDEDRFKKECATYLTTAKETLAHNRGTGILLELIDSFLTKLKKLFHKNGSAPFKEIHFFRPKTAGVKTIEVLEKDLKAPNVTKMK